MILWPCLHVALALVLSPLLLGVINRTKAVFAGRRGAPLLQPYYDLAKLLRKGAVYSRTTTWVFRFGPVVTLAGLIAVVGLVPLGGIKALAAFPGDLILFAYIMGLGRFFTVLAALDTGSAFEGMGASREVQFSALSEPALLLGLGTLAAQAHSLSLTDLYSVVRISALSGSVGPAMVLVAVALFIVALAENARIPMDDPNTHLELTMIHEVMVLDHGGVDLAFIQYGSSLKMWVLASLVTGLILPIRTGQPGWDLALGVAGQFAVAIAVGVVESTMARLRLVRVPQLLAAASILATVALILVVR
jgi:formate hydrogenlyase subunit 4